MIDLISWFLLCTFVADSGGRIKSHAQAGPELYSTEIHAREYEQVKSSNKNQGLLERRSSFTRREIAVQRIASYPVGAADKLLTATNHPAVSTGTFGFF